MNLPNKLTILRIVLIPVMAALYFVGWHYAAAAVFFLAAMTDILDGKIARKHGLVTNLGKFLDPVADKLLNLSALLAVLWYRPGIYLAICTMIIIAREFMITGFRTVAAARRVVIAADRWGKLKTVVQDVAIVMLLADNPLFSLINVPADLIVLGVSVVLTIVSGVNYLVKNAGVLKESEK